jgi:hypothetical protein
MTCRVENGVTFKQVYNAENRISSILRLRAGACDDTQLNIETQWDFAGACPPEGHRDDVNRR